MKYEHRLCMKCVMHDFSSTCRLPDREVINSWRRILPLVRRHSSLAAAEHQNLKALAQNLNTQIHRSREYRRCKQTDRRPNLHQRTDTEHLQAYLSIRSPSTPLLLLSSCRHIQSASEVTAFTFTTVIGVVRLASEKMYQWYISNSRTSTKFLVHKQE